MNSSKEDLLRTLRSVEIALIEQHPENVVEYYAAIWRNADTMQQFARSIASPHTRTHEGRLSAAVVRTAIDVKAALAKKNIIALLPGKVEKRYTVGLLRKYRSFREAVHAFANATMEQELAQWVAGKI